MARWLLVCARNRIAALLAFAVVVAGAGAIATSALRVLGWTGGLVVGSLGSLALILLVATHPRLEAIAERMAAEEHRLDPRQRL